MPAIKKLSPAHQQINSLYRQLLRIARDKPDLYNTIKQEFKCHSSSITKSNTLRIEYEIRRAEKYIDLLQTSGISNNSNTTQQYITYVNSQYNNHNSYGNT